MQSQTQTSDHAEVIDDFADCNTCLRFAGGRTGFWHGFDIPGWPQPEIVANPDLASNPNLPTNVLHISGETIHDTNYAWGLELWPHGSSECDITQLDLAAYTGISFWLKNATGAPLEFTVVDKYTLPPSDTNARYSSTPAFDPNISDGLWHFYSVQWAQLVRRDGSGIVVDPHTISAMTWEATNSNAKYDLFLGDVELIPLTPTGG